MSEIIDGEAVILDLRHGRYYTTDGVGAEVWRAASAGALQCDIVASCLARFPDQPAVEHDIGTLLDSIVAAGLLEPRDGSAPSEGVTLTWPTPYRAPALKGYDDLADMMALDPIHDVDPTGWPTLGPHVG